MQAENPRAASRLTALYEAHSADAFRYALHLTGRREDAEDVVQFVFLQAYRLLESGEELVNPRAWLIRATKHRSLNLIRDRRETATANIELAPAPRHDVDSAEAEALADVRSTLWALPENQHHAFVLRHWSGLSQDEIAEVLATTPGAVESLLVRARTTLLQDQREKSECVGVRRRLVQALTPTGDQEDHIAKCRRCRTARARLLHASEFAATFTLIPRPYVAHALAAAVPGFSAPSAAAVATTATGVAGSGAGGGAGLATASAATKLTLATKIALAATTAVVALGATHPVRNAVAGVLLPHQTPRAATPQPKGSTAESHTTTPGSATSTGGPGGVGRGRSGSHHTTKANPSHPGKSKAKGKGKTHPGGGNGKPKGTGKPANSGTNGKTHGKSASAGTNGKGKPTGAGNGTAKGKSGTTSGGSKTAPGSGKGKGKTHTTGTTATGIGKGAGTGKGKG